MSTKSIRSKRSCEICKKTNHITELCKFRCQICEHAHSATCCKANCRKCSPNGVYHHFKTPCPIPTKPKQDTVPPSVRRTLHASNSSVKPLTAKEVPVLIERVKARIAKIDKDPSGVPNGSGRTIHHRDMCSTCEIDLRHSTCVCELRELLCALQKGAPFL